MINHLNEVNDVKIYSVFDDEFKTFGRVHSEYDFSQLIDYMNKNTSIPSNGNVYVPSVDEMEALPIKNQIQKEVYGGMPIQIGYCNGPNSTYNGFEYHKCSELNIAVTDFCLVLGHSWNIDDNNQYFVGNETVFYVPQGTCVEMFQTTLHLSPCKVNDEGFKGVVILLKGTNTPLEKENISNTKENELLLQKNKWVLCHKDREPLVKQGAHIGLIGENKSIKY